jgi:FMN phosphatase YigB (HAD superfamily)
MRKFIIYIVLCLLLSFNQALARRLKGEIKPIESLIKKGYYIQPWAREEVEGLDIKLVSFDWSVVKLERNKEQIESLLKELAQPRYKIKMVIVSGAEGAEKGIWKELRELGWDKYFKYVRCGQDKGRILEEIARENKFGRNQVVHFDDEPRYIKNVRYSARGEDSFFAVGVVGRVPDRDLDYYQDLIDDFLWREASSPVIITDLGIGFDKIAEILRITREND